MSDGKDWSQHLLIVLIGDQLGLAKSDVFGQGILKIGQGKVSEKSGNFTFYSLWEPLSLISSYKNCLIWVCSVCKSINRHLNDVKG